MIVLGILLLALAAGLFALSGLHFAQKGFLMNNAYLYATKKQRETMYKAPYYRQSAVVFLLLGAVFAADGIRVLTDFAPLDYAVGVLLAAALVYAILSTVRIERTPRAAEKKALPLRLVKMSDAYREQLTDMMDEWLSVEKKFSPAAIRQWDYHDFDGYLAHLERTEEIDGRVPNSVFFALDTERNILVGAVDIRHYLTEELLFTGGHIGDGIRPSERRKGYATAMIGLALEECRRMGIDRVLMTCDKDNIGSAKSIRNNGGVLENEVLNEDGVLEQRYWIDLTTSKETMP